MKLSRWFGLARIWAFALAMLIGLTTTHTAFAVDDDSTVVSAPRDEPLVLQPSAVKVPPIPASYTQKDLGWLQLSYPASAQERVDPLIRNAETIKADLQATLGQTVLSHVDVRIARDAQEMASLAPA
ncbi:MAG: hypothetical protein ABI183_00880, partial [Polyangiaceae bacterium]